ncbi:MAG: translation initiation factor [Candidatus Odinarchaeota archaeon]|jgi:translation initiation factor 1|nr:translation initiation factor [Candidatus Hermodarchaeota archaeon]
MSEICPICSLPKEICRCQELAKTEQRIKVSVERRKWGREVTLIEGINSREISLSELVTKLKMRCACGGSAKEGVIVLQGDHRHNIKGILGDLGFPSDNIDIA